MARNSHFNTGRSWLARYMMKLGRKTEARAEFERAASLTQNARERKLLLDRAAACTASAGD